MGNEKGTSLKNRIQRLEKINAMLSDLMVRWFSILIEKGIITAEDLDAKKVGDFTLMEKTDE